MYMVKVGAKVRACTVTPAGLSSTEPTAMSKEDWEANMIVGSVAAEPVVFKRLYLSIDSLYNEDMLYFLEEAESIYMPGAAEYVLKNVRAGYLAFANSGIVYLIDPKDVVSATPLPVVSMAIN